MKVFFLGYTMNFDGCDHLGVFSSEENAEAHKQVLIKNGKEENEFLGWHYYIVEYELDNPLQNSSSKETDP